MTDHPRVCGEHFPVFVGVDLAEGSPPRLRGAPNGTAWRITRGRITPAFAGSTVNVSVPLVAFTDHPRVCGEHGHVGRGEPCQRGSPPRLRGAPRNARRWLSQSRITPAFAGSTLSRWALRRSAPDHPRVCGEHAYISTWRELPPGSPPRLRGALVDERSEAGAIRITPAFAGSTHPGIEVFTPTKDHPRVCGEHLGGRVGALSMSGSPPRLRGARQLAMTGQRQLGITPAFAGSTTTDNQAVTEIEDHPRVCGEHHRGRKAA